MKEWIQNLYLVKNSILEIYTDGSHNSKRLGGIGIFYIDEDENETEYSYHIKKSLIVNDVNNLYKNKIPKNIPFFIDHIELYAIYKSLRKLQDYKKNPDNVIIYTDSDTAYNFINKVFRNKDGSIRELKNELGRKLVRLIQSMIIEIDLDIDVRCVKGHSKIYGNVRSDKLAGKWRKLWKK